MKRIRASLILLATAVGGGCLAYQLLLTDEAKESLSKGVESIAKGYATMKEAMEDRYGVVMESDDPLPNVIATKRDWEALGY